jgi:hypothetical protein
MYIRFLQGKEINKQSGRQVNFFMREIIDLSDSNGPDRFWSFLAGSGSDVFTSKKDIGKFKWNCVRPPRNLGRDMIDTCSNGLDHQLVLAVLETLDRRTF